MCEDRTVPDKWSSSEYRQWASENGPASLESRSGEAAWRPADRPVTRLLEEHRRRILCLQGELHSCRSYLPDILYLFSRHPIELRFHRRLLLSRDILLFRRCYEKTSIPLNRIIFPYWAAHMGYYGPRSTGERLHLQVMALWLWRLDADHLSYPDLADGARYINERLQWLRRDGIFDNSV
jgi:hypothetical protein